MSTPYTPNPVFDTTLKGRIFAKRDDAREYCDKLNRSAVETFIVIEDECGEFVVMDIDRAVHEIRKREIKLTDLQDLINVIVLAISGPERHARQGDSVVSLRTEIQFLTELLQHVVRLRVR